jgi:Zn-dependent protease with chaperone function
MLVKVIKKFFTRKKIVLLLLVAISIVYSMGRLGLLYPDPAAVPWVKVDPQDLLADSWYRADEDKRISHELSNLANTKVMRLAANFYVREYKQRYSPGIRRTRMIKVDKEQYPDIYEMVLYACESLATSSGEKVEVPTVYIGNNGGHSLQLTNFAQPTLLIASDFLWAFSPEELQFLIGREIGHLQCNHLYLMDIVVGLRAVMTSYLPKFASHAIFSGLAAGVIRWLREANVSADRAGLLVIGNPDVAFQALIKLNVMANLDYYYGAPNPEAFAKQSLTENEDEVTSTAALIAELESPNPFLTYRVGNLIGFVDANSSLFMDRHSANSAPPGSFDMGE